MASEDSEEIRPGLLAIHRLRDLHDVGQPLIREVVTRIHEFDTQRELLEVLLLCRPHRICPEERNDRRDQVLPSAHHVAI